MRRLLLLGIATAAIVLSAALANAQLTPDPTPKTGRTDEALKNDADIDKAYRAKAGQNSPNVKADPWSDVRTPSPPPAAAAAAKAKR